MPDVVHCFNDRGLAEFSRWIRNGAIGEVPASLLTDSEFSAPMAQSQISELPRLKDRYEFGVFLVELLTPYDPHLISYNKGLWSWLAALFFCRSSTPSETSFPYTARASWCPPIG